MRYLLLILLSCFLIDASAQAGAYEGTWQHDNGNEQFVVQIWKENDVYLGHYKKIIVDSDGKEVSIVYNSRRVYDSGYVLPFVIYTGYSEGYGISGVFHDNTIAGYTENFKRGRIDIIITQQVLPDCTSCVILADWKVRPTEGMKYGVEPPFSVPTDITLTKVSNTVVWD